MRVMHVITGLETGGAEISLCRLTEALHPPDYDHFVVSLSGEGALTGRVRKSVAELVHLGMRQGRPNIASFLRLRKLIRTVKPDVVHGWMYHANLMTAIAIGNATYPVIWGVRQSLYDLREEKVRTRLVIKACAKLSRRARAIVYNAEKSAEQHGSIGFSESSARVIPNGYDLDNFRVYKDSRLRVRKELGIANDTFVIGHVARWHPVKDHGTLLAAASVFFQRHEDAVLILAGDGVGIENPHMTRLLNEYKLEDKVVLCGRRNDIPELNSAFDVATSSSLYEAFPNTVAEAMACGVPCVATDVGDARRIIGDVGYLVPARDANALCRAWEEVAALDTEQRGALGERARERIAARYSMAACADAYARLYSEIGGTR